MGTGAGLAVLWGSSTGIAKEPSSTLLTLLTHGVVLAALSTRRDSETERDRTSVESYNLKQTFLPLQWQFNSKTSPKG